MLEIQTRADFAPYRYILDVIFGDWLGIPYRLVTAPEQSAYVIRLAQGDPSQTLTLPDVFLWDYTSAAAPQSAFPKFPLDVWTPSAPFDPTPIPILFGEKRGGTYAPPDGDYLGIDVFGSAFYLLTRLEENHTPGRDPYGRFSVKSSSAGRGDFVMRPLVNEYLELLWIALKRRFPGLTRRERSFRVLLSFDVDQPFAGAGRPFLSVARSLASDAKKRRPPAMLLDRARAWLTHDYANDPCSTFDYLMDEAEKRSLRAAFYFIAAHTGGRVDGDYTLDQPPIRALMKRIHERGHEIGLHTSYNTYNNAAQIIRERDTLAAALEAAGIDQPVRGGRQHWLRWEPSITWNHWNQAGMEYDSSVGFYDSVGFRASTCYDFSTYTIGLRQAHMLRERPLIAMESSLYDDMDVREDQHEAGLALILPLVEQCRRFNGDFVFLWHNHNLRFPAQRRLFTQVLDASVS